MAALQECSAVGTIPNVRTAAQLTTDRLTGTDACRTAVVLADVAAWDRAAAPTVIVAQAARAAEWQCAAIADAVLVVRLVAGMVVAVTVTAVADMVAPQECAADRSMAGCSEAAIIVVVTAADAASVSDLHGVRADSAAEGFMVLVVQAAIFMVR